MKERLTIVFDAEGGDSGSLLDLRKLLSPLIETREVLSVIMTGQKEVPVESSAFPKVTWKAGDPYEHDMLLYWKKLGEYIDDDMEVK